MFSSLKIVGLVSVRNLKSAESACLLGLNCPNRLSVRNVRSIKPRNLNDDYVKLEKILRTFESEQASKRLNETTKVRDQMDSYEEKLTTTNENNKLQSVIRQEDHNLKKTLQKSTPVNKEITPENQFEMISEKVTPFAEYVYVKQLKLKYNSSVQTLKQLGLGLRNSKADISMDRDNMPCMLDFVVPSPDTEAYRNKDEFSIRCGVDGNPKTVGFFLESTADNANTLCVGPDKLINIKDSHKELAKEFENYIRKSPLPACHNFIDGGYWRNIVVRSNTQGDVMGIVIIHPQQMNEEQIEAEKNNLKDYFSSVNLKSGNLKSLYFQTCVHTRCTHAQSPFQLLLGEPHIVEKVGYLKFQLSPESFFQINTSAAEQLYKLILKSARVNKSTTVLDICCGTGPISMTFAPHVKNCFGIDISNQAIEDAKMNAKINDIHNVKFFSGRCEHLLGNLLNDIYAEEIVAVVNPSRSALSKSAINILRECKFLKKIIFVSCKPLGAIDNFIQLCRPSGIKTKLGAAFSPVRATPVDLFPQTSHCELVIEFQRF